VTTTVAGAAQAAQRILTLSTESLDMMRGVTAVVKESLDRADAWVERLRIVGVQRAQQHELDVGDFPTPDLSGNSSSGARLPPPGPMRAFSPGPASPASLPSSPWPTTPGGPADASSPLPSVYGIARLRIHEDDDDGGGGGDGDRTPRGEETTFVGEKEVGKGGDVKGTGADEAHARLTPVPEVGGMDVDG